MDHLGELAALGTAACWTVTALAFESASRRVGSLVVNLVRLVMALAFLSAFSAVWRGRALPTDAGAHAWLWLSASGVVGFFVGDGCLFRAFVMLGARLSMLLMALVPPLTALGGWLVMGERLGPPQLAGMALTVAGVSWVVLERGRDGDGKRRRRPVAGILLGLGGAAGQAFGLVLSKYGMGSYDPFAATQIRVIAGILSFSALFSLLGWWPRVSAALPNHGAMARTGLGAFTGPFLGVSLSLLAVQHTQTGVAATIMALVPVLIIAPAALLFRERVTVRAVAGAVVAVCGTALLFW